MILMIGMLYLQGGIVLDFSIWHSPVMQLQEIHQIISNYFWAATTSGPGDRFGPGRRFVQTSEVDVSQGGSIEFLIRYGADCTIGRLGRCEDGDAPNEEVISTILC